MEGCFFEGWLLFILHFGFGLGGDSFDILAGGLQHGLGGTGLGLTGGLLHLGLDAGRLGGGAILLHITLDSQHHTATIVDGVTGDGDGLGETAHIVGVVVHLDGALLTGKNKNNNKIII